MRYYEIVFMVRPDQGEQIFEIIERYKKIIINSEGVIYRMENWGKRQLAYPIKKLNKAYYVLLNVKISMDVVKKLNNSFHFDDCIIRSMILRTKNAVTKSSPMMKLETSNN